MKTLHLLRHAKSSRDDPALPDHDRPLAPRGEREAALVGRHLGAAGFRPDLVLCSTARRAADTFSIVERELGAAGLAVRHERGLYLSGRDALLARLRSVEDEVSSVLLVAHNPDLHELAVSLAADGPAAAMRDLADGFPTSAFCTLRFAEGGWRDVGPGRARLEKLLFAKRLG
jgi:phosphohistidine phosphatase